ncbi:MAG: GAF domain-containing protein [Thermodesulfobacteriota bacterium]
MLAELEWSKPPIQEIEVLIVIEEMILAKRREDLIEIARLVSWCTDREYLIKTCLDHINQRLGMRARCVLKEGEEWKLHCWVGRYHCPMEQVSIGKESVVWKVVEDGTPVNLTEVHQCEGYRHTLAERVKIKAVIPLWYVDSITQEERRVGALIADSGKKGVPVSEEDFEYLKVVGELIGAAIGKAELTEQLIESYKRKEIMVRETAHAFRNRLTAIGGFSRRIAEIAKDNDLAKEAKLLYQEVKLLESHLEQFEKYL